MSRRPIVVGFGLLLAACGMSPPAPSGEVAPTLNQEASPTQNRQVPENRQPLVVAVSEPVGNLAKSNHTAEEAVRFLYSSLYRLDTDLVPQPDLALAPCGTRDAQIWRCSLREAIFHDGTPLTADDVVFSYELAAVDSCQWPDPCFGDVLASVRALDSRSVEFRLREPYSPFVATVLAEVLIESRSVVESDFETLTAAVEQVGIDEVRSLADAIQAETNFSGPADCTQLEPAAAAVVRQLPISVAPSDSLIEEDPCGRTRQLGEVLDRLVAAHDRAGVEAIASVYELLPFNRAPVGTGPYRCEPGCIRQDGTVRLAAFDAYHAGLPAASEIRLELGDWTSAAVAEGEADWQPFVAPDDPAVLAPRPNLRLAEYVDLVYYALQYNVRRDALFADVNLRRAVQLCIDKEGAVEAATHGNGVPVDSPIPAASWAHHPGLPSVERNVEAARDLIEESGWMLGADGIYARSDGSRLAAAAYVRDGQQDRIDFLEILAEQVEECGIEIELTPVHHFPATAFAFPHVPPGAERPWDLYFGGWSAGGDPDPFLFFHSSQCTSEREPDTFNYICYENPRVDELIEDARATVDLEARREMYSEIQEILAEEQPYLFAWAPVQREALDPKLSSTGDSLDFSSPTWDWQREALFVAD